MESFKIPPQTVVLEWAVAVRRILGIQSDIESRASEYDNTFVYFSVIYFSRFIFVCLPCLLSEIDIMNRRVNNACFIVSDFIVDIAIVTSFSITSVGSNNTSRNNSINRSTMLYFYFSSFSFIIACVSIASIDAITICIVDSFGSIGVSVYNNRITNSILYVYYSRSTSCIVFGFSIADIKSITSFSITSFVFDTITVVDKYRTISSTSSTIDSIFIIIYFSLASL